LNTGFASNSLTCKTHAHTKFLSESEPNPKRTQKSHGRNTFSRHKLQQCSTL
jgi:hypothetical protein